MGRILFGLIAGLLMAACTTSPEELILQADLSAEHDEGRFTPEAGDRLSLAADFTGWEPGRLYFTDEDGDWIYEARISKEQIPSDTLRFKLVITSEENRDLPNSGWEVILNREVTKEILQQEQPVFTFNEVWSPLVEKELTFRVNMANQQVLGFFDPEAGDRVAVTGNFLEPNPTKSSREEEGIVLSQSDPSGGATETPLVYEITFPVEVREQEPVLYQYRIIPGKERKETAVLPNRGLEFSDPRRYREEPAADFFNKQTRVLLVEISRDWLEQKTSLSPDDVLHLKLSWNGTQSRNYRLEANGNGSFETAVQVPESAADLKGKVVVNYEGEILTIDDIQVNYNGKRLILNQKVQL